MSIFLTIDAPLGAGTFMSRLPTLQADSVILAPHFRMPESATSVTHHGVGNVLLDMVSDIVKLEFSGTRGFIKSEQGSGSIFHCPI